MKNTKFLGALLLFTALILTTPGASATESSTQASVEENNRAREIETVEYRDGDASTQSTTGTERAGDPIPDIDITLQRGDVGDVDGDGYADAIREGGQTVDAGTVPEIERRKLNEELLEAKSTPNRETPSTDFPLSDTLDERDEEFRNAGIEPDEIDYDESGETNFGILLDSGDSGNGDGEQGTRLRGITIDYLDEDSDDDGLPDAESADHEAEITLKQRASIKVDGAEVRGWDQKTKEAVRARLAENDAKNDTNNLGMFTALQALDNEAITDISIEKTDVSVAYKTKLAVFGFIPVQVNAKTHVKSNGEVVTDYPWWRFFARRAESDSTYADVALSIQSRIATE